jgi:DNA-binding response OmpR family regulator
LPHRDPPPRRKAAASQAILVVEDDADFGELLVDHLRSSGRRVLWARHGGEALREIERCDGAIGLVLLDLRMPVMDGFEVCRRIDRSDARPGLPIVIMTAEHEVRDVRAGRHVVAVLHKPLELDRLDALVDEHVAA